tara:strand:+ start:1026 stop:2078 length:1053 start_codon:yes stop_codon:yes gene_type:complete
MENEKHFNFYKHFVDLIPEPILIIEKKEFKIQYANIEFQIHFKKSFNSFQNESIDFFLNEKSFLESNLKKLIDKTGFFLIKEIPMINNETYEIKCIIPEEKDDYIMLIFGDKESINKSDDKEYLIFDETFSILSHEINNPLSSIKMAAQLIEKTIDSENLDLINIIKSETARISKMMSSLYFVNDKINFINTKKENIHEIIRYSIFKLKQKENFLNIIENFDPSLPEIELDKNSMIQVFDNIFMNCYESSSFQNTSFMKISSEFIFGETVKIPNIKSSLKKNYILIKIEDNGRGIMKENLEKIFIPFFSTKKRGSGVGLFLVKKIISYHNGLISVHSNNKITRVSIKLPL